MGEHVIKTYRKQQKVIALSLAEAGLYAMVAASAETLALAAYARDLAHTHSLSHTHTHTLDFPFIQHSLLHHGSSLIHHSSIYTGSDDVDVPYM